MMKQPAPVDMADLSQVPSVLWSSHKYDAGLMKSVTPLVIHPKSHFRPCMKQNLLKRETLEGIKPIFDSLLQAGVIIPCDDSLVHTPIFPVKKLCDTGQPTKWCFIQDLQALNATIHLRVLLVLNLHTILSLIPPEVTHISIVASFFLVLPCANIPSAGSHL